MLEIKVKKEFTICNKPLKEIKPKHEIPFLICCVQREGVVYIPDGNFIIQPDDKIGIISTETGMLKVLRDFGIANKEAKSAMLLGGSTTSVYLANALLQNGHSVTIIEKNENRCNELASLLPGAEIYFGDGAKQEILNEAGISHVDGFVTLTGKDEENLLLSVYALTKKVSKIITKVNRPEWVSMSEKLGLDTIVTPSKIISNIIVRYANGIKNTLGNSMETLHKVMDDNTEAVEFVIDDSFAKMNIPLKDLGLKHGVLIAGILRDREPIIPYGSSVIKPNDRVIIISTNKKIRNISEIFN